MIILPAQVGEHVALTELALRSVQQGWGYPQEFMAWEPEAITVEPEHISGAITNVLVSFAGPHRVRCAHTPPPLAALQGEAGRLLGFYVLMGVPPEMELSRMMVEPDAIGTGCGRRMWDHAVETASRLGVTAITLDADPNAEPFYLRMGAETVGQHEGEPPMMPGWRVKKMRYAIPAPNQPPPAGRRRQYKTR
ncbi:MAG: GNAT family N-acetyltransferase [Fimbriimonadales bacterium]